MVLTKHPSGAAVEIIPGVAPSINAVSVFSGPPGPPPPCFNPLFQPDPSVAGEYRLSFSLLEGNVQEIVVAVIP